MRRPFGDRRPRALEWIAELVQKFLPDFNNPRIRSAVYQLVLVAALLLLGYEIALNAKANLDARHIASGLGFLNNSAGFGINQTLIPYDETSSYGRVFLVGLLNTVLLAAIGILLATLLGFLVGIGRLSTNWPVARIAGGYVELIRNLPLLFQILFWYLAVLSVLPSPRQSISIFGLMFLSNRGLAVPTLQPTEGMVYVMAAFAFGLLATIAEGVRSRRLRDQTGRQIPLIWRGMALSIGLPLVVFLAAGLPLKLDVPRLEGFNFTGGGAIRSEFLAALIALTTYTASFIAEVVRAGILAVPRGQIEAAAALGLRQSQILRFVLIPQALRIIVPPLTNQYLNLTKNTSLGVGVGYPDLFAVFAGTALNQTGQAIEIIGITMAVYLVLSLATAILMNWYNSRVRLTER
jgi:general L-amino acid transport system permease protein